MLDEYESRKQRQKRLAEQNEEDRRHREDTSLLEQAVPSFTTPLRTLADSQREEVAAVRRDPHLSEEGRATKLREMAARHRQEVREQVGLIRGLMDSFEAPVRVIARVNDEPQDETRYARLEREFQARVAAGRIPDLRAYLDAVESGDADLIRVYEVLAPLYIEDVARRDEFNAAIEEQREARLTDTQRLARKRLREVDARRTEFEMGLRHGAFGAVGREVA